MSSEFRLEPVGEAHGSTVATLSRNGRPVGRVCWQAIPGQSLVVTELSLEPPDPRVLEHTVAELLASVAPLQEPYPCYFVHDGIDDARIVAAYQATSLATSAELSGLVGDHYFRGVPLRDVAATLFDTAGPTAVCLHHLPPSPDGPLDREGLVEGLGSPASTERIRTLKRAARDPEIPGDVASSAVLYALLDPHADVRRFATSVLARSFPCVSVPASPHVLLSHLDQPLRSLEELGLAPAGEGFDPVHACRNKRYAILWTVGLVTSRRAIAGHELEGLFGDPAALSEARDRELLHRARADLDGPAGGIGAEERLTLLEMARYAVLRARLLGEQADRFSWLRGSVSHLIASDPGAAIASRLLASGPGGRFADPGE